MTQEMHKIQFQHTKTNCTCILRIDEHHFTCVSFKERDLDTNSKIDTAETLISFMLKMPKCKQQAYDATLKTECY